MPPQAARSERQRATRRRNCGEEKRADGDKMRVLLSRPATAAAAGAGGVVRSDKRAAELCRLSRLAAAGAERTARPQKPPQRLRGGGIRHQPPRKAAANVTKPAFCYAARNRRRIKSKKLTKGAAAYGGLRQPPYAFRVPRFPREQKSRSVSRKAQHKSTDQGFLSEKPDPRFP